MSEHDQKEQRRIPQEIVTDGFTLRALVDADPAAYFQLIQDSDVQRFIPWAADITDVDRAAKRLQKTPRDDGGVRYGIYVDDVLSGFIAARREGGTNTYQTGSALVQEYRGEGLTNQAFSVIVPVLRDLGADHVSCYVSDENEASKANIAKRGLYSTEVFNDRGERRWEMELV